MSHSRDGPGVTAPSQTNIVPLTAWNPPPLPLPSLKESRKELSAGLAETTEMMVPWVGYKRPRKNKTPRKNKIRESLGVGVGALKRINSRRQTWFADFCSLFWRFSFPHSGDPPVLKIQRRVNFGTGSKFGTEVAKRYGEGSEMLVF